MITLMITNKSNNKMIGFIIISVLCLASLTLNVKLIRDIKREREEDIAQLKETAHTLDEATEFASAIRRIIKLDASIKVLNKSIMVGVDSGKFFFPIREYYFNTEDESDKAYVIRCAEELVELLNRMI